MVSGTLGLALPKQVVLEVEGGSRAAAPKGSMTYTFMHVGNFLLLLDSGHWALIWVSGLEAGEGGRADGGGGENSPYV